ncbi:MAG: DNA repair protein RecO [Gammaproteobacteria bacterium]|nr:DNA repair protein RecO [Gammaproteobacteria bacterium]
MQRIDRQPAFVLHRRAYRESSLLLDLLTRDFGRVGAVVRGARGAGRGQGFCCQPLGALLVSWSGRGELKTLTAVERIGNAAEIGGERLYSALYVNEILVRLLPQHDAHPLLFDAYARLLAELPGAANLEARLRGFELLLLQELGYGIAFDRDAANGAVLEPSAQYVYVPEHGFSSAAAGAQHVYPGWVLEAIGRADYSDPLTRRHARQLVREAFAVLLGERPLHSREFFVRAHGSGAPPRDQ